MREILFRGKDIINGEWHYGYFVHRFDDCIIHSGVLPGDYDIVKPETIGQYTGLKDKNGKKIFEGDIIEGRESCFDYIGYVEYDNCGFWNIIEKCWHSDFEALDIKTMEVIGNIHDNPELLKGE